LFVADGFTLRLIQWAGGTAADNFP
jgi:hypothetical protein